MSSCGASVATQLVSVRPYTHIIDPNISRSSTNELEIFGLSTRTIICIHFMSNSRDSEHKHSYSRKNRK